MSCSSIKESTGRGKDQFVKSGNSQILKGCSFRNSHDALSLYRILTDSEENFDTTFTKYSLCLQPLDNKHLKVDLLQQGAPVSSLSIKGKYSGGYFKIRRWKAKFVAGPVVWSLTDQLTSVGLSKDNKLVLVYTTGGQLLLVLFPIMAANGPDAVYEFVWNRTE